VRISRKLVVLAASGITLVALAGTAFAYWTASGSGTASAAVRSTNPSTVTLHGSAAPGLFPGSSVAVSFTADNNDANQAIAVGTIHLVSVAADSGHSACDTSAFHMSDVVSGQKLAAGAAAVALTAGGTLAMDNTAANQDSCKGATMTLTLSSVEG